MLPDADRTLPKSEMLSGKTAISKLMMEGRWGAVQPLKYCFRQGNGLEFNRLMVSVPKKFFKRAVRRNLLKRRLREAYRLNKEILSTRGTDVMLVYNSSLIADSRYLQNLVRTILEDINRRTSK